MEPATRLLILAFCGSIIWADAAHADSDSDQQNKLRDALRNAITQVRALEDERAQLQAKQAESDQAIASLKQQVETLQKEASGPGALKKEDVEQLQAAYNAKLAAQADAIVKLNDALEKARAAGKQALDAAQMTEAGRVKALGERDSLWKQAASCQAKNVVLFNVANEILDRLKQISLGDVLGKRLDPFVGSKRVELQNIAQDYQDKLLDQKVTQ